MKRWIAILLALSLLLGLGACRANPQDIQFYILDGEDLEGARSNSALLSLAKKEGRVAFTGADIQSWHWESHHIRLKNIAVTGGAQEGGSALFMADPEDLFLLVLDGQVLYAGEFEQSVNTVAERQEIFIKDGEGDDFYICCHQLYESAQDPRNLQRLYDYLADCQLLISEEGANQ